MDYKTISKDRKFLSSKKDNGLTAVSFEITNYTGLNNEEELSVEVFIQGGGNSVWLEKKEVEKLYEFLGVALKEYDSAKTEVSD